MLILYMYAICMYCMVYIRVPKYSLEMRTGILYYVGTVIIMYRTVLFTSLASQLCLLPTQIF